MDTHAAQPPRESAGKRGSAALSPVTYSQPQHIEWTEARANFVEHPRKLAVVTRCIFNQGIRIRRRGPGRPMRRQHKLTAAHLFVEGRPVAADKHPSRRRRGARVTKTRKSVSAEPSRIISDPQKRLEHRQFFPPPYTNTSLRRSAAIANDWRKSGGFPYAAISWRRLRLPSRARIVQSGLRAGLSLSDLTRAPFPGRACASRSVAFERNGFHADL